MINYNDHYIPYFIYAHLIRKQASLYWKKCKCNYYIRRLHYINIIVWNCNIIQLSFLYSWRSLSTMRLNSLGLQETLIWNSKFVLIFYHFWIIIFHEVVYLEWQKISLMIMKDNLLNTFDCSVIFCHQNTRPMTCFFS